MMGIINKIHELFISNKRLECLEYPEKFECRGRLSFDQFKVPSTKNFEGVISQVKREDKVKLTISFDAYAVSFYSDDEPLDFLEKIKEEKEEGGVNIEFIFTIEKKNKDGIITIYDVEVFFGYLNKLCLSDTLNLLKRLWEPNKSLIFSVFDLKNPISTKTIHFRKFDNSEPSTPSQNSKDISKRDEICHFQNSSQFKFTPYDFHLEQQSGYECIDSIFNKLCFIFSVIYIFDISEIKDDIFNAKIKGYRSINIKIAFKEFTPLQNTYFKICDWIYHEGNFFDKIGIARNVISLYLQNCDYNIDDDAFKSVISNFSIYLKENVQKYIDLKNQISDNIISLSQKASSLVDTFANSFKQNIIAFVTFFTTVIVVNTINEGKLVNIFTRDISWISYGLFFISFIYLLLTTIEFRKKVDRFDEDYKFLKRRYDKLIEASDLKDFFDNDRAHARDMLFLERQLEWYFFFWTFTLIIFATIVTVLGNT